MKYKNFPMSGDLRNQHSLLASKLIMIADVIYFLVRRKPLGILYG